MQKWAVIGFFNNLKTKVNVLVIHIYLKDGFGFFFSFKSALLVSSTIGYKAYLLFTALRSLRTTYFKGQFSVITPRTF